LALGHGTSWWVQGIPKMEICSSFLASFDPIKEQVTLKYNRAMGTLLIKLDPSPVEIKYSEETEMSRMFLRARTKKN
jgi:hypothetical protein